MKDKEGLRNWSRLWETKETQQGNAPCDPGWDARGGKKSCKGPDETGIWT